MKKITFYVSICFLLMFSWIPATSQINLDQNLVVYYPLNGNGLDFASNRRNMSASGSPTATADHLGNAGMAMNFNGTDSYFSAGSYSAYEGMVNFTISVWFKTSVLKNQMLVAKHSDGPN